MALHRTAWALMVLAAPLWAERAGQSSFLPLDSRLPAPNEMRLATGAPGPAYWQQRADYDIKAELDTAAKRLYGSASISYTNNSPHRLNEIWVQLDQNRFKPDSKSSRSLTLRKSTENMTWKEWSRLLKSPQFDGGMRVTRTTVAGTEVANRIIDTLMRIPLPEPLEAGGRVQLTIDWWYPLVDLNRMPGPRSGYETLLSGHDIFVVAQWYPRVSAYTDYGGWRHKSFLGLGEFTLEFGNFNVAITLPDDYLVAATGELQNATVVLSNQQRKRFVSAQRSSEPQLIVTPEEARQSMRRKASRNKKTWEFKAEGVRDFAFSASRAFIWDAMGLNLDGSWITVMSFYPQEVAPLWRKYVSRAAALTLEVFSRHTFKYPYPVSVQVNGPVFGMEYPMLSFMSSRPYPDGSYWGAIVPDVQESPRFSKYALISTTIHEVGHNFFPMIVNSDERHWTWMDEGLTTFLQFVTEQEWSKNYPSRRGWVDQLATDLRDKRLRPIMSDADTLRNRGLTGYAKPAAALNVLRELVLGREVFDEAFRSYANRWKFRRPTPADFFRSMEDASGTDLDWFWRTWFYRTGYIDLTVEDVRRLSIGDPDPEKIRARTAAEEASRPPRLTDERNSEIETLVERRPGLKDFYDSYDPLALTPQQRSDHQNLMEALNAYEKELLETSDLSVYVVRLKNLGSLISPVPLRLYFADGSEEDLLLPAEVWRYNEKAVNYPIVRKEKLVAVEIDPGRATGDADSSNNRFPPMIAESDALPVKEIAPDNPLRKSRKRR